MNRSKYFDYIETKLSELAYRLEVRGGLNLLNLHLHSENFYLHLFNILFGWELKNLNAVDQNAAAIDLIDDKHKVIIQVSATATKQKIESALAKDLSKYKGYSFKFIAISKDAGDLRTKTFANPHGLIFSPANDIFDVRSILSIILVTTIDQQKKVYEFLLKELKSEIDPQKIESNLTTIINLLSKEDWNTGASSYEKDPYDIEDKITYNQLDTAKIVIEDYKVHYSRVDSIYTAFDKQGANKSLSILDGIRAEYLAVCKDNSPDQCFFLVIDNVVKKVRASANYISMPDEELNLCVRILVVDAFIRCKIFKNPIKPNDAHPR